MSQRTKQTFLQKTIALTRRNFVGKVISLLFNMLSRLVITFFPRSKRLLISSPKQYGSQWVLVCPGVGIGEGRASPYNEYSELISFRMAWLDLLAVQGTLKSLSQHHSSKASIPRRSAFFSPGKPNLPLGLRRNQTTQGNRLSCRHQEGRRGSEDAVPAFSRGSS